MPLPSSPSSASAAGADVSPSDGSADSEDASWASLEASSESAVSSELFAASLSADDPPLLLSVAGWLVPLRSLELLSPVFPPLAVGPALGTVTASRSPCSWASRWRSLPSITKGISTETDPPRPAVLNCQFWAALRAARSRAALPLDRSNVTPTTLPLASNCTLTLGSPSIPPSKAESG